MSGIRINKFIAEAGICSRREADRLIQKGQVKINGARAEIGATVSPEDDVVVNGNRISSHKQKLYIAFHKPYGVITTTDPRRNNTVLDHVKTHSRVYPVGRLDVHSSGLLLLTNDGDIVNRILKSKHKLEKEYVVTVNKPIKLQDVQRLRNGIEIDGRKTLPAKVQKIEPRKLDITLVQGRNRQIRKMCEALGYDVKALERIRIGELYLDDLAPGKWRHLTKKEIESLGG